MRKAPSARRRRGITLIEMLIVMLIVGLLAALTYPSMTSGLDAIRVRTAADTTSTFLTHAMTKVERSQQPMELLFQRGTGRMEMRAVAPPPFQREYLLPEGVVVTHVLPEPPVDPPETVSVILMPGATFPAIAVEIQNARGQRRLIRIDPLAAVPIVEAPR